MARWTGSWSDSRESRVSWRGKHLSEGMLILYDVTSRYYTGHQWRPVQFGYNRDGKRWFPQIVYGLLSTPKDARSRSRFSRVIRLTAKPSVPK